MANKVFAVFLVCIVVAATVVRETEAELKLDYLYKGCYDECQKDCQSAGSGYSSCEMKCDEDCSDEESKEKLNIRVKG
ncbi:hypothetical protein Tsubulata_039384 [Turnera subulata]|uniref:Major pollen allergen Ole e 6-like n=1 Tax=Turnera subulata TaxID=218843 RepID=A0A9Q0JKV4_9ROSI|nr:hypothetical protein Tsubulata_039384 [Turnera subulata]